MKPVVWYFVRKYTDGLTFDDNSLTSHHSPLTTQERYTFVSNHRDIVLDSAFLMCYSTNTAILQL